MLLAFLVNKADSIFDSVHKAQKGCKEPRTHSVMNSTRLLEVERASPASVQ